MPHIGLLIRLIQNESLNSNWECVLDLLDRVQPLADLTDKDLAEFLLYHRGYALLELDRHCEAVQDLQRLVLLDDSSAHYRLLLADSLIRDEDCDGALAQLEAGLRAEPDHPGCMCAMGWALYQKGERDTGKALLGRAIETHPDYHPAHLDLGLIHATEGQWEVSERHLRAALEVVPDDPEIQQVLEAVTESRTQAESEKRRIRDLWPQLRRCRRDLNPDELRLLRKMRDELRTQGASHLDLLLAEKLWSDFAIAATRRPRLDPVWAAAIVYASGRIQGRTVRRSEVARQWGVSQAGLARRFRRMTKAMDMCVADPRYAAETPPAADIAESRNEPERGSCAATNTPAPQLIPVDFVRGQKLPDSTPCPCGSGHSVSVCPHIPAP